MLEIKRLQGCIDDLIGVVALSEVWASREPQQIVDTLLKVLIHRLELEFAAARLIGNSPVSSAASRVTVGAATDMLFLATDSGMSV